MDKAQDPDLLRPQARVVIESAIENDPISALAASHLAGTIHKQPWEVIEDPFEWNDPKLRISRLAARAVAGGKIDPEAAQQFVEMALAQHAALTAFG